MTPSPLTYARNGALASLGRYTIMVTIVLVLSGSFSQARPLMAGENAWHRPFQLGC
ncbi:hypothetical protein [Metapseudomonas otitidis]|uniref:hypothetical protein n=1 Tax=Metapseudomonas otitidis TaxID=319939 RepID=UPI0013F5AAEB|nr:hypothetical protein [Pseudomonas otitidis]